VTALEIVVTVAAGVVGGTLSICLHEWALAVWTWVSERMSR